MTDLRKAAEMALEALIVAHPMANTCNSLDKHSEAMSALRQALAQPEQEPVAWVEGLEKPQPRCVTNLKYLSVAEVDAGVQFIPLYTAPPSKPDVNQELVEALNTILWTRAPNKNPSRYAHTVEEIAFRALAKHDKLKEQA